ncbi:protein TIFY 10A-like [Cicer arietinum]|uniref:Protein TIFY n=1 Tax=Cicer arietinum TaxID=3827 RepID=A0A1S2YPQ6_CICAR|nr:protein TIFY 10A-like [Cicer arietinum]
MSSSSENSGFSGHKPAKLPEKSNFSHTCNLLSQYIKENGSFGGLTLGKPCTVETNGSPETSCNSGTTMELFPTNMTPQTQNLKTLNLLSPNDVPALENSSVFKEPKTAQLTMFYGGKIIVLDEFPANKVEELISFARTTKWSTYASYNQTQPSVIPNLFPQAPSRLIVCEQPIARKASLHRFLEKRKDRIAAKAPYQKSNPISAPVKPVKSIPWLGLGATSTQV